MRHSIMFYYYSILLVFLHFPLNIFSTTACDLFKLPPECHCPHTRPPAMNETRLRCRQLTDITADYQWSSVSYDRLTFETFNDNLTLHRYVFLNLIARTLRFNVQHLYLNDHAFENAYIGQLVLTYQDAYGQIHFESNSEIFYNTIVTNLHFKSINFQKSISELIFSNAKIHTWIIQSSKFYGFTNEKSEFISHTIPKIKQDQFLDYDIVSPSSIQDQLNEPNDENSSTEREKTITIDIQLITSLAYVKIYRIISSINITNLTENFFPNNFDYNQLEEIEISFNHITSLDPHVFRHLKKFKGELNLSNNEIKYLDVNSLTHLSSVKNLSLANNFIRNLTSKHFQELNQLVQLDLSSNQIYELNNNIFEHLTNLQILYLNYNPLEFIHSNTFSNLTKLKQIHFQGVQFIHLIDQQHFQWIWNLASLHVIHLLKTDFDLSDVAFCILSRYNQTLFHLSRQHSCSCNIHYFNRNQDFNENRTHDTNYLRLTPICHDNETTSIQNQTDLILQGLEDKCNYKLMFIDCNAMTTTSTTQMTTSTHTIPNTITHTTEIHTPSSTPIRWANPITTIKKKPLNNMKKLFTVLGTLAAITIGAIILVFFWYRFKTMLKRRKKKKNFIESQRQFNSSITNNHPSTAPRYASSDILDSIHSGHLFGGKTQSEALIESPTSKPITIYKNIDAIDKEKVIEMQTIN